MEQELDILALWQVVVKRWIMILVIPLVAAVGSFLYNSYYVTPLYTASTTLMIIRQTDAREIYWSDIHLSRQLVETYREIALSRRVMSLAAQKSESLHGSAQLHGSVNVEAVRDTELIRLTVTGPDPVKARDTANIVAAAFIEEIEEIMNLENISVIDSATAPLSPVSPNIQRNVAVAFMVGLIGAVGLSFLIEYLDQTIKDPAEAQKLLNRPVIGVVPRVKGDTLMTAKDPRSPPAEAFRTMRTNIQYSSVDKPVKKILVTGANPQCGKSTIAANLAVTMASFGGPVLLIDADLRRPTLHSIFEVNNETGLSNLIIQESPNVEDALIDSGYKNLKIITSGQIPPYPAEMLASKRMKELVDQLATRFEYLIFDSPPVIAVTDAAVLSGLADGVLFVIDSGRVKRNEAVAAMEQLYQVQANIIGMVINGMPAKQFFYNGYRYYYGTGSSKK